MNIKRIAAIVSVAFAAVASIPSQAAAETPNEKLIAAVAEENAGDVRGQIALGANPRFNDNQALSDACLRGNDAIVKILLDAGADPNGRNQQPMMLAAWRGHISTMKLLIERGGDPQGEGNRPLARAAAANKLEVIDFLLSQKVDINANEGFALASALAANAEQGVKHLLAKGANPHARIVESTYAEVKEKKEFAAVLAMIDSSRATQAQPENQAVASTENATKAPEPVAVRPQESEKAIPEDKPPLVAETTSKPEVSKAFSQTPSWPQAEGSVEGIPPALDSTAFTNLERIEPLNFPGYN